MRNRSKVSYQHRGIGLIELLVSMLIGLFIMAGVLQMFSTSSQNSVAAAGSSRIQENIRFAFARLAKDIAQSGNLGCMSAPIASRYPIGGGSKIKNLLGFNDDSPVLSNSLYDFVTVAHGIVNTTNQVVGAAAGTDVFRIRFFDNAFKIPVLNIIPPNQVTIDMTGDKDELLQKDQIVGVSNCTNGVVFMLDTAVPASGAIAINAGTPGANAGIYNATTDMELSFNDSKESQYYLYGGASGAYEYYIGSTTGGACDVDTARQDCALFRRSNSATQELVQGVHDMEVLYGSTTAGNLAYRNSADVTSANDWPNVDRLKVTMMFNSIEFSQSDGNNISGLGLKTVSRTFNLYNQL